MALLTDVIRSGAVAASITSIAACYQPTLRDCTVSCTGAADCAGDQVCASGGWCAGPGVTCSTEPDAALDGASTDADRDATADASTDAAIDTPIDASADLRIVVDNRGTVVGDQPGMTCAAPPGDCTFGIAVGTVVMLTAVDGPGSHTFIDWTTPNCQGAGRTCTLMVNAPVTLVSASFD